MRSMCFALLASFTLPHYALCMNSNNDMNEKSSHQVNRFFSENNHDEEPASTVTIKKLSKFKKELLENRDKLKNTKDSVLKEDDFPKGNGDYVKKLFAECFSVFEVIALKKQKIHLTEDDFMKRGFADFDLGICDYCKTYYLNIGLNQIRSSVPDKVQLWIDDALEVLDIFSNYMDDSSRLLLNYANITPSHKKNGIQRYSIHIDIPRIHLETIRETKKALSFMSQAAIGIDSFDVRDEYKNAFKDEYKRFLSECKNGGLDKKYKESELQEGWSASKYTDLATDDYSTLSIPMNTINNLKTLNNIKLLLRDPLCLHYQVDRQFCKFTPEYKRERLPSVINMLRSMDIITNEQFKSKETTKKVSTVKGKDSFLEGTSFGQKKSKNKKTKQTTKKTGKKKSDVVNGCDVRPNLRVKDNLSILPEEKKIKEQEKDTVQGILDDKSLLVEDKNIKEKAILTLQNSIDNKILIFEEEQNKDSIVVQRELLASLLNNIIEKTKNKGDKFLPIFIKGCNMLRQFKKSPDFYSSEEALNSLSDVIRNLTLQMNALLVEKNEAKSIKVPSKLIALFDYFTDPLACPNDIRFGMIEPLLTGLGIEIDKSRNGSRMNFKYGHHVTSIHLHDKDNGVLDGGRISTLRTFLLDIGFTTYDD
jgi:hypothetical protein